MKYKSRNDQLNQLDGDKARMDIGREECSVFMQGAEDTPAIVKKSERGFGYATDLHVQNFLDCVRTRRRQLPRCGLGFQAALVVQLANLSLRHGKRARWNNLSTKWNFKTCRHFPVAMSCAPQARQRFGPLPLRRQRALRHLRLLQALPMDGCSWSSGDRPRCRIRSLGFDRPEGGTRSTGACGGRSPESRGSDQESRREAGDDHDGYRRSEDSACRGCSEDGSALGLKHYRWGGFRYDLKRSLPDQLAEFKPRVKDLAAMNKHYGLTAMYHTHSG